ncbi:MAG: type IV toxin-antitoxin system AbiEi family antitoxin domain-containing protein [Bacteroidota bacterium]
MALNATRRKEVQGLIPEGALTSRPWLLDEGNLSTSAVDNLVKSGELTVVAKGVYTRGNRKPKWQVVVEALQQIFKTDLTIGGLTALELKGYGHYVTSGKKQTIHLYGTDKLPYWVNLLDPEVQFRKHLRSELFQGVAQMVLEEFYSEEPFDGNDPVKVSRPELACLELLADIPDEVTFNHAHQLLQGITTLSPRKLQRLLELCTSVKTKRLFLWFGKNYEYNWYQNLKLNTIHLGSGNRVIAKGGQLDNDFKITVPITSNYDL